MRMRPSEYLRARAKAILERGKMPHPLGRDWLEFIELVRPQGEEWNDIGSFFERNEHCLRLCLAAAIAEADGL